FIFHFTDMRNDANVVLLYCVLRQGSNELHSSSSPERSGPVMLSVAKHLSGWALRCFATLSMTGPDCSNCQGLCFIIETCLIDKVQKEPCCLTLVVSSKRTRVS